MRRDILYILDYYSINYRGSGDIIVGHWTLYWSCWEREDWHWNGDTSTLLENLEIVLK